MQAEFQAIPKTDFAFFAGNMGDCSSLRKNLISSAKADNILKEYRSINCKTCTRHFGYQQRLDGDIYFCSSPCLAVSETETQKLNGDQFYQEFSSRIVPTKTDEFIQSKAFNFKGRVLSPEDREVAEIMKTKGKSTVLNSHGQNLKKDGAAEILKNDNVIFPGRDCSDGHTVLFKSKPSDIEKWRQNAEVNPEAILESEDLPVRTDSVTSFESEDGPLRGNKDMIAAARKKSLSPPSKSVPKVSALIRPNKAGTNGKAAESPSDNAGLKDKPSLEKTVVESKKPKRWAIGNLAPSSSFANKISCYVAFPWSPVRYTLNAAADASKQDELCAAMAKYCGGAPKLERLPSVGEILFAPYNGDFYRAVVKQVLTETKYLRVSFIDYGDSDCVKLSDCREPSDEIMNKYPVFGIEFECLVKRGCPPEAKLPAKLAAIIQEKVYIEGRASSSNAFEWKGRLYTDETCTNSFNDHLDKWISSLSSLAVAEGQEPASTKKASNEKMPKIKSESTAAEDKSEQVLTRSNPFSVQTCKRTLRNATISPNLKHGAYARVNYMWNYQNLNISAVEDDENFKILGTLIKRHVKTASGLKRDVEVGEIVIAPYDESFYRGVVTSLDGGNALVRFLDYGDQTVVPITKLIELSPEIDKHPIYGIIMKMHGVPDQLPKTLDIENMNIALEVESQIDVMERSDETGVLTGYLWVASDLSWNDMVLSALKSKSST